MSGTRFRVSAFGDEVHPDFETQLEVFAQEGFDFLDLRSVDNTNIVDLDESTRLGLRDALAECDISVPVIGSPVGKVDVTGGAERSATRSATEREVDSFEDHLSRLEKAIRIAGEFDAEYVRVFSYYVPEGNDPEEYRDEIVRRFERKVELAAEADVTLLHENVSGIYGESPARLRDLLTSIDSPHFRAIFDAANFYKSGARPFPDALLQLVEYVDSVHVKDARRTDEGTVEMVPLGEGDVDLPAILSALHARGFDGWLSLEPHLSLDDPSEGLSGREEFVRAARALHRMIDRLDA